MRVLVTGSAGLIGSEAVEFFDGMGFDVIGVDNNMRADFFGPNGDTTWNRQRLEAVCSRYTHRDLDIRDRGAVEDLIRTTGVELVIPAAAPPSHDPPVYPPFDGYHATPGRTRNIAQRIPRP